MSQQTDLKQFVRTYPGVVDDALIPDLTALTGSSKLDEDFRRCSITPVVGEVLERFRSVVRDCFMDYRECSDTLNYCTLVEQPYVVRYEPSTDPDRPEHFEEHADARSVESAMRQISVIAYMNDVAQGGEPEFQFGQSQRCQKGTILLFPANFLYVVPGLIEVDRAQAVLDEVGCPPRRTLLGGRHPRNRPRDPGAQPRRGRANGPRPARAVVRGSGGLVSCRNPSRTARLRSAPSQAGRQATP